MKRSKWKGVYYRNPDDYKETKQIQKKISRNSSIIPKFIGETFEVHTGKTFRKVTVTKEMLGHKFGEFSKTRVDFEFKKKKKKKKK
jgi:small subunit ribosomal protein S19